MEEKYKNNKKQSEQISKEEAKKELEGFIKSTSPNNSKENTQKEKREEEDLKLENIESQLSDALGKDAEVKKATPLEKSKIRKNNEKDGVEKEKDSTDKKEETKEDENSEKNEIEGKAKPKKKGVLKIMRTYKNDLSNVLKRRKASVSSIMASEIESDEKNRQSKVQKINHSKRSYKPLLIILVIILISSGGFYYFLNFYNNKNNPESSTEKNLLKMPDIINFDEKEEFYIENKSAFEIKDDLNKLKTKSNIPLGQILYVYITKNFPNEEEQSLTKKIISAQNFLESINSRANSSFLRSLEKDFFLGFHSFNHNQPILIFDISSFQNAFSGILKWEDYIDSDLAPFFGEELHRSFKNATSSDSLREFKDLIIENQDTRVLRDEVGNIKLLYSFPTQKKLVITTNKNTFKEILTRLRNQTIVR